MMKAENIPISQSSSLKNDFQEQNGYLYHLGKETRSEAKFLRFIKSDVFALVLSCLLMIGQSFHTSLSLFDLTALPGFLRMCFSITSAVLMDSLIIYFVANGNKKASFIFFCFCALMNLYAFHLHIEYFTYKSYFAMVPAFAIPGAVHLVSSQINKNHAGVLQA